MSSDDQSDGVLAPNVSLEPRVHRVNNTVYDTSRNTLTGLDNLRESLWMSQYGGDRNLFDALGYIQRPRYEHYRSRYARTDTAPALVDKLPKKAWAKPKIVDTGAADGESEFERIVNEFLDGRYTDENPINVMERATRMERLGEYSLIFIGLNDDAVAGDENGAEALKEPVDKESLADMDPSEAIQYITPYDQGRVDWDEIDWVDDDPTDSRFGKPESYQVDLGDGRPVTRVHWSRVIHVVGSVFDDEFRSPSVLKQSLNRIDDIEKILGGSAEGYWRSSYTGLVISPPTINGRVTEFSDDGDDLHDQIGRWIQNFSREIFTPADIEPIDVSAEAPVDFLEAQYRSLSTGHDIPQSILMGNETGERATEEDRQMFHERAAEFRMQYNQPSVLGPIIDRLRQMNVFPEPVGTYRVVWPPLEEKTAQDEANIVQTMSNGVNAGSGGNPFMVMTPEEYRVKVLGWKAERGSEVDEGDIEPVSELDEADPRVQEQFNRLNRKFEVKDKVEVEQGRGMIVDILTTSFEEEGESVEASEDDPTYVVVTEDENNKYVFAKEDEIETSDWDTDVDEPEKDLEEDRDRENVLRRRVMRAVAAFRGNQEGHFTWPESWRKSDKPARLIALDAWASMNGDVSSCIREMRGNVVSPERFCADFADRLYGWLYWRGDSWAPGD